MKTYVLLCVGVSIAMLLITESSAAGPLSGSNQPAPTESSGKQATPDNNAEVPGADIDWALQEVIGQVARAAEALGSSDPGYTVSVVDVENARLQIYRKASLAAGFDLQRYIALAPAGVSVTFEKAALSAKEIENLYHVISALIPEFEAAGIQLSSWGPDYVSGMQVRYTSNSLTAPEVPKQLREKLEIYGADTVTFQASSVQALANRLADTSPFCGRGSDPRP